MSILGDLSEDVFLRDFWQKKPLLIENAFPRFTSIENNPISPEKLIHLSYHDQVTSRIIIEHKKRKLQNRWEVKYGPFGKTDFDALPKVNWSLLVSDIEKHYPDIKQLLSPFRFISDWRIDDLMISYAPPGSSVGAHIDEYDVFLLQVQGTRKWQIETEPKDISILDGLDLKILRNFKASQEWVLEPGDMLYLPPGVPHHGIAEASKSYGYDCMTWSIGFNAPSYQELVTSYSDAIAEKLPHQRYMDPGLKKQAFSGEITAGTIDHIFDIIEMNLVIDKSEVVLWFGCHITEPQHNIIIEEPKEQLHLEQLKTMIDKHYAFILHPAVKTAFVRTEVENSSHLFVDGERYQARSSFAEVFCQKRYITPAIFNEYSQDILTIELITALYNKGYLITRQSE